jgi:subfamily B ATP-binding cassette protein MsbA
MSRQSLFLVGGIVLLTLTHPRLTGTTLAVVPVVVGTAFYFGRRLRRASTGVQDRVAEAMGMADEAFSQIRTVQSFVREAEETRRYRGLLSGVVTAAIARARMRGLLFGVVGFVAFAGVVAVLWQGGRLVLEGALTPGALVKFLLYAITVAAAVGSLASLFGNYQEAIGAAQRVFELLEMRPTVAEPSTPIPLARPVRGALSLESVRFRYAPELPDALSDVSFSIAPGEVVALVGPSGAGKTTISQLVTRMYDVQAGSVRVAGVDVRDATLQSLRDAIGVVTQDAHMFHDTIRANLAYARPEATDDELWASLEAAQVGPLVRSLPDGLDTVVGDRGYRLSGGEKQRMAIARLLLKAPGLVVLDEATAHLDSESEVAVQRALSTALSGRTSLVIAHRLSTIREADQILVVDDGRIVENGRHDELLSRDGLYAELYRTQFSREMRTDADDVPLRSAGV